MTLAARGRAIVAVALILLAVVVPPGTATATPAQQGEAAASELILVRQTPTVAPGGAFDVAVLGSSVVPGAQLSVTVHDRVRSRSELTTSSAGTDLRRPLRVQVTPIDQLPTDSDGARRATIALDDATGGNEAVTVPGVYPVGVEVAAGSGATTTLVTHLIVRPLAESTSPPLAVAVLATVDGEGLDATEIADTTAMVGALNAAPDVPATLAVRPETIDPIALAAEEPGSSLLAALRAAAGRSWLALPYAPVSPDALADAGMPEELLHQLGHGAAVLREALGAAPTEATWVAGPDLGRDGLALLPANGIRHVLLRPDQVQTVADGVLSVARPFQLLPPRSSRDEAAPSDATPVDAMVLDGRLDASLDGDVEPALVASRVLAELASLWFEQEGVARAIVVPVDRGLHAGALGAVLEGLRGAPLFRPVSVDEAFSTAAPLLSRGRTPVERALEPEDGSSLGAALASRVRAARALRGSVETMVGSSAGLLRVLDGHLLRSTSDRLDGRQRRDELGALRAAVDDLTAAITTPGSVTITLTARDGTVPLTIRNDTGIPVEVRIRLRSPKLDLPDGDTITLRLEETTTRRDIDVRTRASGAFQFDVEITSPDGALDIAAARLSVRSTAVSGVGLVLSAGAGLFLVIWWARHWREARRSAKLVDSTHPVHRSTD